MLKEKVKGYIEKIRAIEGITGCALISRDGIMLGQSIGVQFNEPWLAAMCATLFASAESATTILRMPPPNAVSIRINGSCVMILGAGEKLLIVAVIGGEMASAPATRRLEDLAKEIGGAF